MTPIVCIGETLAEREAGQVESVVKAQLVGGLEGLELSNVRTLYEPVWAIEPALQRHLHKRRKSFPYIPHNIINLNPTPKPLHQKNRSLACPEFKRECSVRKVQVL